MIQRRSPGGPEQGPSSSSGGLVLAAIATSGSDPSADEARTLIAARPDGRGTYDAFEVSIRGPEELAQAWQSFREFLGEDSVLCPAGRPFERWYDHLEGHRGAHPACLGWQELRAWSHPRRTSEEPPQPRRAAELVDLARDLGREIAKLHRLGPEARALFADGLGRACLGLAERDPRGAERLGLAYAVIDEPLRFLPGESEWREHLVGGALEEARQEAFGTEAGDADEQSYLLDHLHPAWGSPEQETSEPLLARPEGAAAFDPEDKQRLDEVFETHLPELFAESQKPAAVSRASSYRESQHQVARQVARNFGQRELLLIHAPTGTGKTLAYLVPALLWSLRYGVRVGVATYTRALQEQAMDRDVPRALEALQRSGLEEPPRVTMLKGRENYLCWRALRLAVPGAEEEPEAWLAWTQLLAFAWLDPEGDLDRMAARPAVGLASERSFRAARQSLLAATRARSGCCTRREDRRTCAAEQARRRAERSHVVLTNHALALARQEFLRRVLFDECEHLHDQAHSAFSAVLTVREARSVLQRVHKDQQGKRRSRAPLDRLSQQLLPGTPSYEHVEQALEVWQKTQRSLAALEAAAQGFERWRKQVLRDRGPQDEHSLLREYLAEEVTSADLVLSRRALGQTLARLDAVLAEMAERLDRMPVRGIPRIRRGLELARTELGELTASIETWLPLQEGRPNLRRETFYDVERDPRGELAFTARVLLPNEYLGRFYYPNLDGAVLISATTWMGGSFEGARGYLGLDRAEQVQPEAEEDEPEREPISVRTFRAPEAFDYRRVLVCTPRDAPAVNTDKQNFLTYLRRFLAHLGERTEGRMLVLFTNSQDVREVGTSLEGFFRARDIPLYWQGMEQAGKEELSELFRRKRNSILFGVDTFWYGADFPGETLQYLVMVRLPYGVPDRYHHAQCAAIGEGNQRKRIYQPRALAKFRQGFGRLMRRSDDRGVVFLLDHRIATPRHRVFLRELPLSPGLDPTDSLARSVRGDADHCFRAAFEHMDLVDDLRHKGLWTSFESGTGLGPTSAESAPDLDPPARPRPPSPPKLEVPDDDLPF